VGKSQFEQSEALQPFKGDEVRKDDADRMRKMITAHAILVYKPKGKPTFQRLKVNGDNIKVDFKGIGRGGID